MAALATVLLAATGNARPRGATLAVTAGLAPLGVFILSRYVAFL